ncbi:MAG TPA: right-handed parallel beta-helix repeat-containing protein [Candidatus Nanoarchaeia archaeon]|nr:right-handed parallel beta-helix repeat-containing protein [Candidatus Nanoarchaeia archaeon]
MSADVLNVTISNNTILRSRGTGGAIYLGSENVTIINNTIINSSVHGIRFAGKNYYVYNNIVRNVTHSGIGGAPSNDSFIYNNLVEYAGGYGIAIDASSAIGINNQIYNNTIKYIGLSGIYLINNTNNTLITNNTVSNTSLSAINITNRAGNNSVYNNLFNTSYRPVAIDNSTAKNHWNRSRASARNIIGGFVVGGNFYSDYAGRDDSNDTIGDTPHPINGSAGAFDYLPLAFTTCIAPSDNLAILSSTTLCSGEYTLNDAAGDGLIQISDNSVRLYCSNTILRGNSTGTAIKLTSTFDNITVEGCTLLNYTTGININNPTNNFTILNNTLINSSIAVGSSTNGLIKENLIANYSIGSAARCIDVGGGSENVTVADNIITGCAQWGIVTSGTVNWTIARNNFSRNGYGSIQLTSGFSNVIRQNNFTADPAASIALASSNNTIVEQNTLSFGTGGSGMIVLSGAAVNNTIRNNILVNHTSYNLLLSNTHNNSIESNNVSECFYSCIEINGGSNYNLIKGNLVRNSGQGGIQFEQDSNFTLVEYNTVINSSWAGIRVWTSSYNLTIVNNTLIDTDLSGIDLRGGDGGKGGGNFTVINNTIEYSADASIATSNAKNILVKSNFIRNSSSEGIAISTSTNESRVEFNTIVNSSSSGLAMSNAVNITAVNNSVTRTTGGNGGLYISGSENITIFSNTVTNNTNDVAGIRTANSKQVRISYNTVKNSTGTGIHIYPGNDTYIYQNIIASISGDAISLYDDNAGMKDNFVYNNTIRRIGGRGIHIYQSHNATITNNTILNSSLAAILVASPSGNNSIFNNFLNTSATVAQDDSTAKNSWNRSKTTATNIIGGASVGGNFYSNYIGTDVDGDGIGESLYTVSGSAGRIDYLPLTNNICLVPTDSLNVTSIVNICSGTYLVNDIDGVPGIFNIGSDYTTINCNGTIIIGNQTGTGVYDASGRANITISGCTFMNYSYGIDIRTSTNNLTIKNSNFTSMLNDAVLLTSDSGVQVKDNVFGSIGGSSIHLSGSTQDITIINNTMFNSGSDVILLGAGSESILIENNSIMMAGGDSVKITSSRNVTLLGNYISNVSGSVIFANSNSSLAGYNQIANVTGGLILNITLNITILNNTISNIPYAGENYAIYLSVVSNTTVKNNSLSYISNAIFFTAGDSYGNLIENNYITNSTDLFATIWIEGNANGTTVRLNRIVNATTGIANALTSRGAPNAVIAKNTIRGATGQGIQVSQAHNNTIANNTIYLVKGYGIYLPSSNDSKVIYNNVHNSSSVGIYLNGVSGTDVEYNTVNHTSNYGIVSSNSVNVSLLNNTVIYIDTTNDAVSVQNSINITVKNNTIGYALNTPTPGVYISNTVNAYITSNTIFNLTGSGVFLDGGTNFTYVSFNTMENITGGGSIRSEANLNATIVNNTISKSRTTLGGISVRFGNNITVAGNSIEGTIPSGIYIIATEKADVLSNTITNTSTNPGIDLESGTNLTTISYNTLSNTSGTGSLYGTNVLNISILNNTFRNSRATTGAIVANSAENITVANNRVEYASGRGISVLGGKFVIASNSITNTSDSGILLNSGTNFTTVSFNNLVNITGSGGTYSLSGTGLNISVLNNSIRNSLAPSGAISITGSNYTIKNNTIEYATGFGIIVSGTEGMVSSNSIVNSTSSGVYFTTGTNFTLVSYNTLVNITGGGGSSAMFGNGINLSLINNTMEKIYTADAVVRISGENLSVSNNTIKYASTKGILLENAANAFVTYNTVTNSTASGISLDSTTNFTIIAFNRITNTSGGGSISASGSVNATILNNTIIGSYATTGAIHITSGQNYTIANNTVRSAKITGIFLNSANSSIVENNIIRNVSAEGINLESSSFNIITNNVVNQTSKELVRIGIASSDNNSITNNMLSYGSAGVDSATNAAYNISILNNTISYTSGIGVRVSGAGIIISSNIITNTSGSGISLNSGTNFTTVSYNALINTSGTGSLQTSNVVNISIVNNTIKNSRASTAAIYIGSENITISNNTIINSSSNGIVLSGSNLIASHNVVKNVSGTGMAAIPTNNSLVYKNTIEYTGEYGFVIDSAGGGTSVIGIDNQFFNNTVRNTGLSGIMLKGTINNTLITNNTVSDTSYIAINVSNPAGNNSVFNNRFDTSASPVAFDNSANKNHWNTSRTSKINIIGGPTVGGNLFSDYAGTDTDADGIGTDPYILSGGVGRKDFLPLTNTASACGDGTLDPGEECDDGNTLRGDGCDEYCDDEGTGPSVDACTYLNCNDGDECTIDSCSDGVCSNVRRTCEDSCRGNLRQYGGDCINGACQYNEIPCGQSTEECFDGSIAVCTNDCLSGECIPCTPTCPKPKIKEEVGLEESNTYPCFNVTSRIGKQISIENTSFEGELPEGRTLVIPPFRMSCSGEDIDITLNVPSKYENLELWACIDNVCGPLAVDLVDELKCGLDYTKVLTRDKNEYNPYEFTVEVPKTAYDEKAMLDEVRAGLNKISFVGKTPSFLSVDKPSSPLFEPKNPTLKIIGTPLVITSTSEAYFFNVTMPYIDDAAIAEDSISIFAFKDGRWSLIESNVDGENNMVNALVDTSLYSDEKNTTLIALIANLCDNCIKSTLKKVYEPKAGSRNAVVFIHGLGVTQERFNQILNDIALTGQPWQAWLFGYDSSRPIGEVSREFSDLLEFHAGEFDNLYIVAHSLGGRITQEAFDYSYSQNMEIQKYSFIPKVRRIVMIATPNKGVVSAEAYELFYNFIINSDLIGSALKVNSEVVRQLLVGKNIPKVPGVEYYVVAGTRPFRFFEGLIDLRPFGKNDGIVTIESAQYVGGEYVRDLCKNYWEIDESHIDLLDNPASRKIIEKIIAGEIAESFNQTLIGYNQYAEFSIKSCSPETKFVLLGTEKAGFFDPLNCNCGNNKCDAGENEVNCPSDCAFIPSPPHIILSILPFILLGAIALFLAFKGYTALHPARLARPKKAKGISIYRLKNALDSKISEISWRLRRIYGELRKK